MRVIHEIQKEIWLYHPEHGEMLAHFMIEAGPESHIYWVCFCENGEIWMLSNPEVRACWNRTLGRLSKKEVVK